MNVSLIVGILIGFTLGVTLFSVIFVLGFKYDGKLIIRNDDGEGPYMFLEIEDRSAVEGKDHVILKIKKR